MIKNLSTLLLLMLLATAASAQILPFRTYSIEDGLSESVVNDIVQDSDGYLWIATSYGLNRFDGINIHNYYEEDGLLNNQIHSVYEDNAHRLWIGTESGVNILHSDSITVWPELRPLQSSTILAVHQDQNNEHWFATDGEGVWHLDRDNNLTQYTEEDGLGSNRVRAIAESEDGVLWFATRGGLTMRKAGLLFNYTTKDGLQDNRLRDIELNQSDKTMWVASREGICEATWEEINCYTEEDGLINNRIQSVTEDATGNLWLGTEEGISVLSDGEFKNFSVDEGLSNNFINKSFIDREENVWFGTFGGGISLFLGDHLQSYTVEEGLPNNVVTDISGNNGEYWIGTYGGGIARITNGIMDVFNVESGLVDNKVYSLLSIPPNKQIIGTRWGLSIVENEQPTNYGENELSARIIRAILQPSGSDELWLGTYGEGILKFQPENNRITRLTEEDGLADNEVLDFEQTSEGDIWIATYGGVTHFSNGDLFNYTVQEGLPNNGVLDILEDESGRLWIATFGGFAYFEDNEIVTVTPPEGVADDVCYFIEQDDRGFYWIGTNRGVVRFDFDAYRSEDERLRERAFKTLSRDQGLIANEMNQGASYKDEEGHLWFGTVSGITRFNPAREKINTIAPALHIENIRVAGEDVPVSDHIEVASDNHNISFDFIGISFFAPDQVLYRYRLNNSGEDWQYTTERTARYPALGSGNYSFEIQARNSDGYWTDESEVIQLTVLTPFWQQWWFLILVGLLLIGIFMFIYNHYRIRRMVEIERMRVRIASDLHDDVGSALTEIALQSDFLQTHDVSGTLKESLEQIGQQSRKVVSSLDDIVWSIDARNDTLGDLTDRMQDYASGVLPRLHINYNFDGDMNKQLSVPVKENLYLIFKEAINNISKHSKADRVDVTLSHNAKAFKLIVKDNGQGRTNTRRSGQGLRNIEMRAKRINAKASFNNKEGFTVRIEGSEKI